MNLRVLRYFLTVAKEQSFTKAAEQLNLTQPTLSRQLAALEEELGAKLFDRGGRSITLTGEGVLLKRRALEIVEMEDKILSEFKGSQEFIEGTITIGCGEFMAVETLAEICRSYREKYPRVQIALHTGTADAVSELMGKGIVDVGLFLEPVNTEGMDAEEEFVEKSFGFDDAGGRSAGCKRVYYKRGFDQFTTYFAGTPYSTE